MQYSESQLYFCATEKVQNIYEIFKNFFGEEYVDLQIPHSAHNTFLSNLLLLNSNGDSVDPEYEVSESSLNRLKEATANMSAFIYVWWPEVTVTNEYNKHVVIQDLYAKIQIRWDGTIPYENTGFLLNRATYNSLQFHSGYMHSHIQSIPTQDFTQFMSPCLGRGPIRNTINSLKTDYDETLWMLFCQELAMYVTVESVSGGPWKRLERIGTVKEMYQYGGYNSGYGPDIITWNHCFDKQVLHDFIKYYLSNGHISFCFTMGSFVCGMPYFEFIIDLSNAFIDYYNENCTGLCATETLFSSQLLNTCMIKNGKFYSFRNGHSSASYSSYIGKKVLDFKGKRISISIIDSPLSEQCNTIVISHGVAMYILKQVLNVINFRFKNAYRNRAENTSAYQRVLYI